VKRLSVLAVVLLTAGVAVTGLAGAPADAVGSNVATPAFTHTETITRSDVSSGGTTTVVATNNVTLNVAQTANLQGRQELDVSWSGAHPTGGIVADQNAAGAQYEEYPFVLLECRGVGSSSAPVTQQVSPETCWTQSWTERYQQNNASEAGGLYPPYVLDAFGTNGPVVGQPSSLPTTTSCTQAQSAAPVEYWVPWVAAPKGSSASRVYDGGTGGSCGQPPQATGGIKSALPSNETFGVTGTNGTGSAEFDVFTTAENTTLGCSDTVACSLVAVPIMGISCDSALLGTSPTAAELADLADCEETGAYAPGSSANAVLDDGADQSVTGSLWWSPSNWRNRITVPLTFAPPANACSIVNGKPVVDVYGSTLMLQATDQWEPSFCAGNTDKFSFVQVASPEPEARSLVASGSADAAFTSYAQTGGYGRPVVNAPVAMTGFTISYAISGSNGEPVTTLKLTPLLLAKLLTESYLATAGYGDPALKKNPLNITDDPEFTALNPDVAQNPDGFGPAIAESELISLSSDSDVIEALTTYINDTPAARAFLNGTPDTSMSGEDMVVNPAYKGISLPVDQWPLLSTYESTTFDNGASAAACLANSPEPLYSLIAAPLANLEDVSQAMQFEEPNSTVVCASNGGGTVNSMVAGTRQEAGSYFMLGITPLADDQRYNLQTASLETTSGTFVAPSNTSLAAVASLLKPDNTTGTWPIPYSTFQTSAGASAYPGTMVVYAAVPTSGLSPTDAADYASLLQFAVSTGQTPGSGVGQLPPGYLPLTQADGLGALASYTLAAAADVAAQNGQVPPVTPSAASQGRATPATATSSASGGTTSSSTTTQPSSSSSTPSSPSSSGAGRSSSPGYSKGANRSASTSTGPAAADKKKKSGAEPLIARWLGRTLDVALWTGGFKGGFFVVLIMILALLGMLCVPATYLWGRKRGRW
jgi:hypothetical protein